MALPLSDIRRQFPILQTEENGHPLIYLDDAATSQKPQPVIDAMRVFLETANANPLRGLYPLAEHATDLLEATRETVRSFINAKHPEEMIFTKSTTESINLVARSLEHLFQPGDAVLLSILEHHSNIVPWLQLKERIGIDVRWAEIDAEGQINRASYENALADHRVKLVAITGLSNVLGTAPTLPALIKIAHEHGALVLIDAAQMAAHLPIDVQAIDCDFLAFSGHKIYGPTGIGVLYGKRDLLQSMPPFLGGGMMIHDVARDHFTAADIPARFEAGTLPVMEAAGLKAAIDWQRHYSWDDRIAHEQSLLTLAAEELSSIVDLRILGNPQEKTLITTHSSLPTHHGCLSFTLDDVHPHDLADLLGQQNICIRAGHHCAQPLHKHLGIPASARLSVSIHTTEEEMRAVRPAILDAIKILRS